VCAAGVGCSGELRDISAGSKSDVQVGAFLTALTLSGLESSPDVVAACASVLRQHAITVKDLQTETHDEAIKAGHWDYSDSDKEGDGYSGYVDIVGTGGDGWDTFNVSTTAAVVVAGTGLRVAKASSPLLRPTLLIPARLQSSHFILWIRRSAALP